jgi:hypothetical protein
VYFTNLFLPEIIHISGQSAAVKAATAVTGATAMTNAAAATGAATVTNPTAVTNPPAGKITTAGIIPTFVTQQQTDAITVVDATTAADATGGGQARTGRGMHGLPKVSWGPAMPNLYTPCERPAAVFFPFDTPCRTGLVEAKMRQRLDG